MKWSDAALAERREEYLQEHPDASEAEADAYAKSDAGASEARRDPLDAAHEILAGTICECGHTEGDHILDPEDKAPEPCSECDCTQFQLVEFVVLTPDEAQQCADALESHVYWQLADEAYRKDGAVLAPGSDDEDTRALIVTAETLMLRLCAAAAIGRAVQADLRKVKR